jgi:hypothetical protein
MARRSTPERLDEARRAGTLTRLIGEGELPERAEALLVAWEAQAASEGRERDGAYWQAGYRWIAIRRAEKVTPMSGIERKESRSQ